MVDVKRISRKLTALSPIKLKNSVPIPCQKFAAGDVVIVRSGPTGTMPFTIGVVSEVEPGCGEGCCAGQVYLEDGDVGSYNEDTVSVLDESYLKSLLTDVSKAEKRKLLTEKSNEFVRTFTKDIAKELSI